MSVPSQPLKLTLSPKCSMIYLAFLYKNNNKKQEDETMKNLSKVLMGGMVATLIASTTVMADTEVKIWVADATVEFTKEKAEAFLAENYPDYSVMVEAVGEGDAAQNMLTDVEAGADIYIFAQDQMSRLVSAGALEEVAPDNVPVVTESNDAGSVSAAMVGDVMYAYPVTSDNGYFLYYDKSVVTDPTSLEAVLADCEAAGKSFYMEINSGWYQTAYFFGAGAQLTYDTDDQGNFTACNTGYASEQGLVALKEMIEVASSPAFVNGSSVGSATNIGAIVDGTWDATSAKEVLGENYACAKLPSFTGADGATYQLSGFGGFKLLGVKPQEDEAKLEVCDALAAYLSSGEVQAARYDAVAWGPSNLEAQKSEAVQADEALSALAEQLAYTIPQGQYPGDYWTLATGLGDSIIAGELTAETSDEDLMAALQEFENTCISYAE
ncbi:MAG: extracellular solute-binding protein [Clostridiales bacterium]|nr:extracellular solute-binding protein [Candidatus Blautia equi]